MELSYNLFGSIFLLKYTAFVSNNLESSEEFSWYLKVN